MEFWSALMGALVGGGFALGGAWLTTKTQVKRDHKADERALRDRRHDRLRAAFGQLVTEADFYANHAAVLGLTEAEARRRRDPELLYRTIEEGQRNVSAARAALLLETDQDRALLAHLSAVSTAHLAFVASLVKHIEENAAMPSDEYERRVEDMQAKASALASVARRRLDELETPV